MLKWSWHTHTHTQIHLNTYTYSHIQMYTNTMYTHEGSISTYIPSISLLCFVSPLLSTVRVCNCTELQGSCYIKPEPFTGVLSIEATILILAGVLGFASKKTNKILHIQAVPFMGFFNDSMIFISMFSSPQLSYWWLPWRNQRRSQNKTKTKARRFFCLKITTDFAVEFAVE